MSLKRLSINRVQIPQELLGLAKEHMRVTWDEDDRIIVHKLAHSIDLFEKLTQFRVFGSSWEWLPGSLPAAPSALSLPVGSVASLCPVMRVSAFTATDADDVDITDDLELLGDTDPDSIAPQYLTAASGVTPYATLTAGFVAAAEMPPMITDIVLRITAYLFEFREAQNVPGVDNIAYANSLLANYWIPRC